MSIIPDTLKTLRNKQRLSQQRLADDSGVSKRTIARIESGETPPEKVRRNTIESLAKSLRIAPDGLGKPAEELSDEDWRTVGYTFINVLMHDSDRRNYRWVLHNYDIAFDDLVAAAPWMFTMLAEMSLAERRRQLAVAENTFETAMDQLPMHLGHGLHARSNFEDAAEGERKSLESRDIFGKKVLESAKFGDPFDPHMTSPFSQFLSETARSLGSQELNPDHLDHGYGELPRWDVFQHWLDELTGGDDWALFAVTSGLAPIVDMPKELEVEEKKSDRIEWLVANIPPEMREREEKRRFEWKARFGEIGQ